MTDPAVLAALDRIARGAVGLTAASLAEVAPRHELTLIQWRGLAVIAEFGEPVRVSDVASRMGTAPPSASRLLRRLERQGLVAVTRDDADRRVVLVGLTSDGVRLWQAVVAHRRAAIGRLVGNHGPLPGDLLAGLEAIAASLDGLA